jgi:hypothetical protein
MANGETICYLYCLTPGGCGIRAPATGVDGAPGVGVYDCGGIGAVCSEVSLAEFSGDAAEANLQDLAWLGPRVCRHEAVIEEVLAQAPVLPARFATLFTSRESMKQAVIGQREAIGAFFARLGDRQEWGVKGLLNRAAALEGPPGHVEDQAADLAPGARYFQEKRIRAQWERECNRRLQEFCRQAAAALGAHAGGFRERKVLAAEGTDAEAMLNWAFLISPAALEEFRVHLERFKGGFPGLTLALTGPWPPYSFVPDLSGDAKA